MKTSQEIINETIDIAYLLGLKHSLEFAIFCKEHELDIIEQLQERYDEKRQKD